MNNLLAKTLLSRLMPGVFLCLALSVNAQKGVIRDAGALQSLGPINYSETPLASPKAPAVPALRSTTGKTQTVQPIGLGRSSNAYSSLRPSQNQVYADDSLGIVAFIHRQDVTIFGGGSASTGLLRYDISLNGGQSFSNDVGVLNPQYTQAARYPQITGIADNDFNPLATQLTWAAATINQSSNWAGIVAGTLPVVIGNPVVSTEDYYLQNEGTYLPGGLCERVTGEYWMADFRSDGQSAQDTLLILKGSYNSSLQTVVWAVDQEIPFTKSVYANQQALDFVGANIAFDPIGQRGWAAFLGDISGGNDSVFSPILVPTFDGGQTWGTPIEVDLRSIPWLSDSLEVLWVDSNNNPISSGRATAAFDFDLTVDVWGDPHFFAVFGSASTRSNPGPSYSIYTGLAKYALDITSRTEGQTWEANLVAPVYTFRGEFGTPDINGNLLRQDNYPQIGRTQSGTHIFYSWVDTDTIGNFGQSDNIAPDLWISARRVTDNFRTCVKNVTNQDLIWQGRMLFPSQSPLALALNTGASNCYKMPIVGVEMLANDQLQPCQFWYFGNDASFDENEFVASPSASCSSNSGCSANYLSLGAIGKVWRDDNNNGVQDPGENPVAGAMVRATGTPWSAVSDFNGGYSLFLPQGSYTLEVVAPQYYTQIYPSNPATYSLTVSAAQPVTSNLDFGMDAIPAVDLVVSYSGGPVRPGFNHQQQLVAANIGTISSANATVKVVHDPDLTYNSANPAASNYNAATRTIEWNLGVMASLQNQSISINYTTAVNATLGDTVENVAWIEPYANDADTANNRMEWKREITGAYDPNDKTVYPAGEGSQGLIDPDQKLLYRIRFQNTGNDTAFTVRVSDVLDPDFDLSSFEMVGASHPYTLRFYDGQLVEWRFDNILLPDSTTNEPESHGWIFFKISPKDNLPDGTELTNRADIYFDFNPPILTNSTLNTVDYPTSLNEKIGPMQVLVAPNPFRGETTLQILDFDGRPYDLRIYDLQGRLHLQRQGISQNQFRITGEDLAQGVYLYEISRQGFPLSRGKIISQ